MSTGAVQIESNLPPTIRRFEQLAAAKSSHKRKFLERAMIRVNKRVKEIARSGGVFSERSEGALAQRARWKVPDENTGLQVSGVKYGLIQEFGGQTKPHIIKAKNGKVLAFPWAKYNNAFSIGRGNKRRVFSMKNYSASAAMAGISMKTGRKGKGKAVSGLAVFSHVHHSGSKIPPKRYTYLAYQDSLPDIEYDALRLMAATAGSGKWP